MSYDIQFCVKAEGVDDWVNTGYTTANITWNVRDIITKSTGLEWNNEANNGLCSEVMPKIKAGRDELIKNGMKYKKYEPKNGWGSVENTIDFFDELLKDWCIMQYIRPNLAKVATFWIM